MTKHRASIDFLLGDDVRSISDVSPTTTVLDYLRTVEGRRGTKEGCGEGDCGACTVVLGEAVDGRLQYRAVNSCIQFLPTLDGRQLLTVEDLGREGGDLHPAQKAIVDHHGSQCGFCTPGFVMSLFALERSGARVDRQSINDAIAGNLCRCTGYGPIVDAALAMAATDAGDAGRAREAETLEQLDRFDDKASLEIECAGQSFFAPASGDELAKVYEEHPDAVILSGGTDAGLWVTKQGRRLEKIVYLGRASDLRGVEVQDGEITVWAAATQTDLLPIVGDHYPDFAELLRRFGSPQIRNLGTLCGNVANGSPIGDSAPALIALGARVGLRRGARRREIPLEDFFIDYGVQDRKPGEFVEKVIFPVADPKRRFAAYKLAKRFDQDISAVCGAFNICLDRDRVADIRIAYGGMAAIPKRAAHAEAALIDKVWCEERVLAAMQALEQDFQPISDMRASAQYRLSAAKNLIRKLFLESKDTVGPLRLVGGLEKIHAT